MKLAVLVENNLGLVSWKPVIFCGFNIAENLVGLESSIYAMGVLTIDELLKRRLFVFCSWCLIGR